MFRLITQSVLLLPYEGRAYDTNTVKLHLTKTKCALKGTAHLAKIVVTLESFTKGAFQGSTGKEDWT